MKKNKMIIMKSIFKKGFLMVSLGLFALPSFAQLVEQPTMAITGQYDIRMVSAPVLQPAWVSGNNPLTVVSIIPNEDMFKAGDELSLNNRYASASTKAAYLALKPAGASLAQQVYADCDDDNTTFQSSAAFLDFGAEMGCTSVYKAYLYWMGSTGSSNTYKVPYPGLLTMKSYTGSGAVGNTTDNNKVKFKAPGMATYADIPSSRTVLNGDGSYMHVADVTSHVQGKGGGLYWCANVKSTSNSNEKAGWSLVVIFTPPNCPPRVIKFWDTNGAAQGAQEGTSVTLRFPPGEVPASGNSVSYLGFIGLDGEDCAPIHLDEMNLTGKTDAQVAAETKTWAQGSALSFDGGAGVKVIQPFTDGSQPPVYACDEKGLCFSEVYSGFVSSQITTYDAEKGTNGNQIVRLPDNVITLGYDAHHVKLPPNSMAPGTETAKMTLPNEVYGGYSIAMAYMAIETLQANLKLTKRVKGVNQTAPDAEMTYVLKIENTGPLASAAGALVLDTLDKTIDFVPGSVTYVRGAASPEVAQNVGSDVNENIRFNIPSIAAGDGSSIAKDSVVIEFKVKVKPLSRTDIWGYGCNREVKNRATLTYKGDDGKDIIKGSNATAGCGGTGTYYYTPVISQDLEDQYELTHIIEADLTSQLEGNPNLKIVATLRSLLATRYTTLGLPASDLPKYSIKTNDGFVVPETENFELGDEAVQKYIAEADLGDGCIETFEFEITLAKVPKVDEALSAPGINAYTGCAGAADGVLNIVVSDGTPGYSCRLTEDATGSLVYTGFSPAGQNTYTFVVDGLKAGTYTVSVGDQGIAPAVTAKLIVADPQAIVPTVKTECTVGGVLLKASATARPGATLQYAWKSAADGYTATLNSNLSAPNYETTTPGTYKVIICDAACSTEASVVLPAVAVNPVQQTVSILSPTPQTTFDAVLTGANPTANYQYNWQLSAGSIPGTLAGANTANLTVSNITDKAMNGNKYKVTVTDPAYSPTGCVGIAEGTLFAVEAPVVVSTPYTASCPNTADGSIEYSISNGESGQTYQILLIDEATATTVETVSYTAPAVYTGVKTGLAGGSYVWNVIDPALPNPITYPVTVAAIPQPVTKLTSESVCFGAELIAEASGNHSTYEWTIDGVIDAAQTGSVYSYAYDINTVTPGTDVNIQVVALSALGCRSEAQDTLVTLKVVPEPLVQKAPVPYTSCVIKGEYLDWKTLVENPAEYPLLWYELPVGGGLGVANPDLINKAIAGEYTRYVSAVGDGCPSLRAEIKAVIFPNPEIISIEKVDLQKVRVIVAKGLPPYVYDYEGKRTEFDSKFEINATETFPFSLGVHKFLVIDENQCRAEGFFHINKTVLEPAGYFSPNDDGDNDLWTINHLEAYLDSHITIEIFDRTGKKMAEYEAKDFNGWDGMYKGSVLPSTDYWYSIYIQETDERIVGHFSLKR